MDKTDAFMDKKIEKVVAKIVECEYDFLGVMDAQTGEFLFVHDNGTSVMPPKKGYYYPKRYMEVLERHVPEEVFEQAARALDLEYIKKKLEERDSYSFDTDIRNADGSGSQRKMWKFTYIDDSHEAILSTRTDITDIYIEEQRKNLDLATALTAAQQASAAKTDFLSRMSHEIRTPMNAIIGMSALAAQSIGDDEQTADCISKIGISARFLLSLINDILDMSRIESGKMLLAREEFNFEELVHSVNSICYTQASKKNIDYDCIVDNTVENYYIGDSMKLQQVLINILSNAVKFTPQNGRVTLRISQTKVTPKDAVLQFIINDTGCGMSEEYIPHIFEAFSQENSGVTSTYGGTGLGLPISKNIVDMMDGSIDVRSIKGIGSEFTVTVKLECSEKTLEVRKRRLECDFENLKTLVVDDDISICEYAIATLKDMGIHAEWVDSGHKAVEYVKEKWKHDYAYDMILIDWKMPEMDGIETARRIRRIVGANVTIIIMTAYDWTTIEHEAKTAGVNLLMSKPMFKSNLISAFEKALGKEQIEPREIVNLDFTGKRVLLVEDHPLNIEVATRLLENKHVIVEHAENGLKAMEMFSKSETGYYDAILMDIRMPVMDGLMASNNIRHLSNADATTIPIIAMTANAFDEDVERSKKAGMNAHLAKPIDPDTMYQTLNYYINKRDEKWEY